MGPEYILETFMGPLGMWEVEGPPDRLLKENSRGSHRDDRGLDLHEHELNARN